MPEMGTTVIESGRSRQHQRRHLGKLIAIVENGGIWFVQLSSFTTSTFELIQMLSFSMLAIELIQKPSFRTAAIGRIKSRLGIFSPFSPFCLPSLPFLPSSFFPSETVVALPSSSPPTQVTHFHCSSLRFNGCPFLTVLLQYFVLLIYDAVYWLKRQMLEMRNYGRWSVALLSVVVQRT